MFDVNLSYKRSFLEIYKPGNIIGTEIMFVITKNFEIQKFYWNIGQVDNILT